MDTKKDEKTPTPKKSSLPLKVVYIGETLHNQFEVTDDKPESRKNPVDGSPAHAVAPSSYDRTAINHKITQEDLDSFKDVLEGRVMVGDIVDEREFNALTGKDADKHPDIDDEDNLTDEELNQSKK